MGSIYTQDMNSPLIVRSIYTNTNSKTNTNTNTNTNMNTNENTNNGEDLYALRRI